MLLCTFLASPRKVPKEGDLRGHFEKACPLKKPLRRPASRCPKMSRFLNTYHAQTCKFSQCRLPKIGTFSGVGWRCGGWILKEGGAPRSKSEIYMIAGGNHTTIYAFARSAPLADFFWFFYDSLSAAFGGCSLYVPAGSILFSDKKRTYTAPHFIKRYTFLTHSNER